MSPHIRVPIIDTHLLFHLTDGLPPRMLVIFIDREGYDNVFLPSMHEIPLKNGDFGHIPGLDRLLGQEDTHTHIHTYTHTHTRSHKFGEQTIRMWP